MNRRYLTAPLVLSPEGLRSGLYLQTNEQGLIQNVLETEPDGVEIERYDGLLCPGFVNAHCHLELSHYRGKLQRGTGMAGFIEQFLARRNEIEPTEGVFETAIAEMKAEGIVAVGDIANRADAFEAKARSTMYFHTFVEIFSADPLKSEPLFQEGQRLIDQLPMKEFLAASISPHAPYTMSGKLLRRIYEYARETGSILSLHLLESEAERLFFEEHEGPMAALFQKLGVDFRPNLPDALEYSLQHIAPEQKILFVHCTEMSAEEKQKALSIAPNAYFCLCPRANLFINNKLPDFDVFNFNGKKLCIGTDSLASNDSLSILEELKTIQAHYPAAATEGLLQCATRNGAEFLGVQTLYGSLTEGKRPGVNLISNLDGDRLTPESVVRPLF